MSLPVISDRAVADCDVLIKTVRRLKKPLTNANWENERVLLLRHVGHTMKTLKSFEAALGSSPKPASRRAEGGEPSTPEAEG